MRRILLTLALLGCGTDEAPTPAPTLFDRPQALVFVGDALVVANTGYAADGWRPGALTVLDAATGAVQNRIPTTGLNPQRLVVQGDRLYAVCTGALDFTDFDHPQAASPGAIDVVPLNALADAAGPGDHLALPLDPAAPIDLAFHGDRALVTSALTDAVWPFDAEPLAWTGDPAAPARLGPAPRLALGAVAAWREGFAVVDFNTDRLYLLDAEGAPTGCAVEVGEVPGEVEGAQAPVVDGDTLYVLLVHAGRVRRVDLADLADDCAAPVETVVDGLGLVPNDLHVRGDRLYVVHSGDNNVVAYDRTRGTEVARYVLPNGSNPWHAAFDAAGRRMAVTAWATHAVHVFDVQSTEQIAVHGANETPASAPLRPLHRRDAAAFADVVIDAPGAHEGPFGDPTRAANGARGAGDRAGGLDVYRLGLTGDEAALTLRWSDRRVVDGPGADLVVFENAFEYSAGMFIEALIVEVSADGEHFVAWPHDYRAADETTYSPDPEDWAGFAGCSPTRLHEESAPMDPFDPAAGGDAFDLADLPADDPQAQRIRREGFTFVRLVAATARANADTGAPFPRDPVGDGPDVDAVYARSLVEED